MTTCKEIYAFLSQVSGKNVTATLSGADEAVLSQLHLVQFLTQPQYLQLENDVQALGAEQEAIAQEAAQRVGLAREVQDDTRKTHSVLFRLEGQQKRAAKLQRETDDEARLRSVDSDLAQKQQVFGQLVSQRSLLDTITPYGDRYVGLTGLGAMEVRNLGVRLYRVSDVEFGTYWEQSQKITQELTNLAGSGADYFARLAPGIAGAERSHLWAIAIGLSKTQPDAAQGSATFINDYNQVHDLSGNIENRLMASEVLFSLPRPLSEEYPTLVQILRDVRDAKVPTESALGVASILLLGRRADGTIATPNLAEYLRFTRSYESAALLAIVNLPVADLSVKFQMLRTMFTGWGYQASEDVELSSAYLAVSEVPVQGISTKLAIIAKGLSTYLEYPLVAASVLASLSTLEANETLNLLEHAYDIVGRRASPMSQAELICLAVRMLHGIRNELVGPLDATAAVPQPVPGIYGPRFYFVPIIVARYAYFSTYSGVGGVHPGHVHGFGGGAGGFVG
ncbi:MAG TPA: hypothetical protein VGG32_01940 [Thermoplasmata archaeon]|jgi:hypothetical protein